MTSAASPTKARKSSAISANGGLSLRNSVESPCTSKAEAGMSRSGLTYRWNVCPVGMRLNSSMQPISTTRSPVRGSRPVVSVSSTISRMYFLPLAHDLFPKTGTHFSGSCAGPRITFARHSSNGAQNAMNLRPGGIEAARAIHYEMGAAALFLVGRLFGEDRVELACAHVGAGEHAFALH